MLDQFLEWVTKYPAAASAIAALGTLAVAILLHLAGAFKWLFSKSAEPSQVVVHQPPAIPVGATGTITLTVEAYEARLRERGNEITAQILTATGAERERLIAEKAELEKRLADIDTAFAEAKTKIAELEATLARFGNEIGGDRLAAARKALEAGDFSQADEIFAEVLAREQIAVERAAEAAYGQGQIAEEQVRWTDAAQHFERAARLAPNYDRLFWAGEYLWHAGRYAEAAHWDEKLVTMSEQEHGPNDLKTASAMNQLAESYRKLGRFKDAEPLYRNAIAIAQSKLGNGNAEFAEYLNHLAELLRETGRLSEAELLYREAMEIDRKTIGEKHLDYATDLHDLASVLRDLGRREEAEQFYRRAMEIDKEILVDNHPHLARDLFSLGVLLHDMKRFDEAESLYKEALRKTMAALSEGHPDYAIRLNHLAILLQDMGRYHEAKLVYAQMMPILRGKLGDEHPSTKRGAAKYVGLLRAQFPDDPALSEIQSSFGPDIGR